MIKTIERLKRYAREAVADSVELRARELARIAHIDPSIGAYVETISIGEGDDAAFGLRLMKPSGMGDLVRVSAIAVGPESGLVCGQTTGTYDNRGQVQESNLSMDGSLVTGLLVMHALGSTISDARAA